MLSTTFHLTSRRWKHVVLFLCGFVICCVKDGDATPRSARFSFLKRRAAHLPFFFYWAKRLKIPQLKIEKSCEEKTLWATIESPRDTFTWKIGEIHSPVLILWVVQVKTENFQRPISPDFAVQINKCKSPSYFHVL